MASTQVRLQVPPATPGWRTSPSSSRRLCARSSQAVMHSPKRAAQAAAQHWLYAASFCRMLCCVGILRLLRDATAGGHCVPCQRTRLPSQVGHVCHRWQRWRVFSGHAQPTIAAARAPPHCTPLLQHDSRTVTRVCADMPIRLRAQRELFRLRMIRRARSGYAADCMECQRVGQGQQEADRSLCVRDVGRFARL